MNPSVSVHPQMLARKSWSREGLSRLKISSSDLFSYDYSLRYSFARSHDYRLTLRPGKHLTASIKAQMRLKIPLTSYSVLGCRLDQIKKFFGVIVKHLCKWKNAARTGECYRSSERPFREATGEIHEVCCVIFHRFAFLFHFHHHRDFPLTFNHTNKIHYTIFFHLLNIQ